MKIRSGFVSNSSSSSFIAVGVDCHNKQFEKLLDAINFDTGWHKVEDLKDFDHYDHGQYKSKTTNIVVYDDDANFAGYDAERLFARNMRLSEIRTMFIKQCAGLDVTLHRNDVVLKSGELHGC